MSDLAFTGEVQKHDLKPGDVLVLRVERALTLEQACLLKQRFEREFPDHRCVILSPGASIEVVRPKDMP